jgi:hypothetical protein
MTTKSNGLYHGYGVEANRNKHLQYVNKAMNLQLQQFKENNDKIN